MKKFAVALLLGGASTVGLSGAALAQASTDDDGDERIVVTGSRTITNGNNSPIPVTIQSFEELQATTPTTIAEGLAKLPSFQKGYDVQIVTNTTQNRGGNYLNLRGFGLERNLILQDGRRVPATSFIGAVDANSMPSLLVERVDTVTGGVSAVYGSDAVSGVVNYILDHDFNGVKGLAQAGISDYGDSVMWRAGIAAGTDIGNGAIHVEASFDHQDREGIFDKLNRPAGGERWCRIGRGTMAEPYEMVANCRSPSRTESGLINRVSDGLGDTIAMHPAFDTTFAIPGTLTPFIHGVDVGGGTELGGQGNTLAQSSLTQGQRVTQGFGRIDFNPDGALRGFLQGTWTQTVNTGVFVEPSINNFEFFTDNPFLSAEQQAILQADGGEVFRISRVANDLTFGPAVHSTTDNINIVAGLEGEIADGRYNWNIYYSYGQSKLVHRTDNNADADRLAAALDAVEDPDTGEIVCYVTLVDPTRYPDCVPFNVFGLNTGLDRQTYAQIQESLYWYTNNTLHNVGGTFAGTAFDLPAGPAVFALSGEYRSEDLSNIPSDNRNIARDCTNLRLNCPGPGGGGNTFGGSALPLEASQSVWEVAAEVTVPVLADVPGAETLDVTGAVRHTNYSTSGDVQTWKLGATWRPIEDITFRVTRSRDIRAPTLWELFQPATFANVGLFDSLTGVNDNFPRVASGNENLVPEIANTWTAGVVLRPRFIPDFSVSVDYYKVTIDNALISLQANTITNEACIASGGTAVVCDLFVRPNGWSDTDPSNYPTEGFAFPLNAAFEEISGIDVEANYLARIGDWTGDTIPGTLALRFLLSYQPDYLYQAIEGDPIINRSNAANEAWERPGPSEEMRWSLSANYRVGGFSLTWLQRWKGELDYTSSEGEIWNGDGLGSIAYTDLAASYSFGENEEFTVFGNVQNLFNQDPRIYSRYTGGLINFRLPIVAGDDPFGRYFTAGVRFNF